MTELSTKISLTHAICSMEKIFPHAYMFYPRSFLLPAHYDDLKVYWKDALLRRKEQGVDEKPYFIVKPNEGTNRFPVQTLTINSTITIRGV
ncbi:Tubulin-tyrosine ligase [Parelaphostrongylus tenuis]|uniref:Tubulin-tyrosine ligase n=1 Tax=Parelaphostrongylus tenuis TaxID=148309 RepID=A0AAD5MTB5_PARTN|nr:Tubulin-tyrosine ligase [Parelaphostrongylus tenuis]